MSNAMPAYKVTVTIPESRHIAIDLPSDFPVGEAEVVVLYEPKAAETADVPVEALPRGHWKRVEAFIAKWDKVERPRTTAGEVDADVSEERASWEDEVPTETLQRGSWKRLKTALAEIRKVERPHMTKEEIDAYLAEERASWGDDP